MATVTIVIEDGELAADGRPHVNIHMTSKPAFALRDNKPDIEQWSSAQSAAYLAIEEVVGTSAAGELIVVADGDEPEKLSP